MLKSTLAVSAGFLTLIAAADDADAFWYARGWRGGVAVGGFRPPAVVGPYYLNGCLRCAPYYHPAIAAALAARAAGMAGAAAAGAAAGGAVAAPPPAAAAPAPAAPSSSAAATPSDQDSNDAAASSSGGSSASQTAAASPTPSASPGKDKASACAAGLAKDSKTIYDATAPHVGSLANLRDTVVAQTKQLVMAGKIGQVTAKSSAQAAGECLALLAHN
jgi:hypothetical protein